MTTRERKSAKAVILHPLILLGTELENLAKYNTNNLNITLDRQPNERAKLSLRAANQTTRSMQKTNAAWSFEGNGNRTRTSFNQAL